MSLWKGGKQKRGLKQSCVGSRLTAQNSEGMRMQELLLVLSQVSIDYDLSPSTYPLKLYISNQVFSLWLSIVHADRNSLNKGGQFHDTE